MSNFKYLKIIRTMLKLGDITYIEYKVIKDMSEEYEGIRDLLDMYNEENELEQFNIIDDLKKLSLEYLYSTYSKNKS